MTKTAGRNKENDVGHSSEYYQKYFASFIQSVKKLENFLKIIFIIVLMNDEAFRICY